ncbi:MAG: hypothetical protein GF383_04815 [Candidatus Lokiarchaeota archaeon]|nr:hypothetical protein [Candidatus Lokiarchaeota archaeon]MBD3339139.1 hypothetical protein [Candidatus Lokiarchaeota archaeon]
MTTKGENFGEFIEFSVKKRFGIISLTRVHRSNAFTINQLRNLKFALEYCQKNEKIRGVILTNQGDSFSTGMDLDYIDGSDHEAVKDLEGTAAEVCQLLYNGIPAICAVNGRAMGEGVVFAIACDYRIATEKSFFQMPEIYSGIFPGTGCTILFSKLIGIPWTKKMLMFAEKVDSSKALEIGLIDKIVKDEEKLIKTTLNKAKFLFSKNQAVLNAIKLCSNHLMDRSFRDAYEIEKEASAWYEKEDKEEFVRSFRKKFNFL